jgi:ACS family tartrate transporter-like MFS transporter
MVKSEHGSVLQALSVPKVWQLGLSYHLLIIGTVGIGMWLPQIVKAFSSTLTNTRVGWIVMVPYLIGAVLMQFWSKHSDRTGERRWHTALPALFGSVGLFVAGNVADPFTKMVGITFALVGICCFQGPFWALSKGYLNQKTAVVGIAAITATGNLGGFVGPTVVGYLKQFTGTTNSGLLFIGGSLISCFLLVMYLARFQMVRKAAGQGSQGA